MERMELLSGIPDLYQNKAIMFYSAPKVKYIPLLKKYGIRSILISYWYIRQKKGEFLKFLEFLKEVDGILMVDSGAHTFKHDKENREHWCKAESYKEYLDEYIQFCYDYAPHIYCCVNIDMDNWVGVDVVDRWNANLFQPLNKVTNVIFNVDSRVNRKGVLDKTGGLIRLEEYVKEFDYIGVNRGLANNYSNIVAAKAALHRVKVHGFAVTSLNILKTSPMFSVDSTSWLMGDIFGVTYTYDGKNHITYDKKKKGIRKAKIAVARNIGIDSHLLLADKSTQVSDFNLYAWRGFEKEFIMAANLKLKTLPLKAYDKRQIIGG